MEIVLLKIDKIKDANGHKVLEIPIGGIQLEDKEETLSLNQHLEIHITPDGYFKNVTQEVEFVVYFGSSIFPIAERTHTLINVLAVEGLLNKIYGEVGIK